MSAFLFRFLWFVLATSILALGAHGATPCDIATRKASIGGGTIAYNTAGSGRSVLQIHGRFAHKEQWDALACKLADAGHRAGAVDLPGYGKSSGGDDDHVFAVAGAQKLARRFPRSELRRLPDAGHLLHMESAEAVAPLYIGFLKSVASAPARASLANPASQNCSGKGGALTIEKNGKGDQFGVCVFPDNLQCEEWAMLRGECRTGGIKVTGFATPAARYCAITGGSYAVTSGSNTPTEQGICTFKGGRSCEAGAYYAGTCSRQAFARP